MVVNSQGRLLSRPMIKKDALSSLHLADGRTFFPAHPCTTGLSWSPSFRQGSQTHYLILKRLIFCLERSLKHKALELGLDRSPWGGPRVSQMATLSSSWALEKSLITLSFQGKPVKEQYRHLLEFCNIFQLCIILPEVSESKL